MPATGSPTARRLELGSLLRTLREEADLTTEQVAQWLGVSHSKISRLESGQRGAREGDILRLCELYQVDDEQCQRLTQLAVEGKQRSSRPRFSLPNSDYFGLEREASSISDWGLALVPGLLQTPDYARVVVRGGVSAREPRVVEERVRTRIARQQLLFSEKAPSFEAVLDESVLHRIVGGPAVMALQLGRLLEMSELDNVTIRVVPYDAGAMPAGVNKFVIFRFALPDLADTVLIEELTTQRYLKEPEQVETYNATFRALARLSADAAASRVMLLTKMTAYQSMIS